MTYWFIDWKNKEIVEKEDKNEAIDLHRRLNNNYFPTKQRANNKLAGAIAWRKSVDHAVELKRKIDAGEIVPKCKTYSGD